MSNRTGQRRVGAAWAVTLAMILVASGTAFAQRGAPANGEWPTYGGDLGGTKYSPLDQIDRSNFGDLEIAWRWLSADAFLSIDTPDGGEWWADSRLIFEELLRRDPDRWRDAQPPYLTNLKATPLMVGGRLFINMPTSQAASIDAATGETLWVYNPKTYEEGTTTMSARWNQRGVAYWSDGPEREDERILFGTGNGYLVCVDAKTGRPCPDFGEDGWIDLTEEPPARRPQRPRLAERVALLGAVAAAGRRRHHRHAVVHLVLQHHEGSAARLDARVRPTDRAHQVDVPHDPAGGRVRQRHVGRRFVARDGEGRRLVVHERRSRAGADLSADQYAGARLLRRAPARR